MFEELLTISKNTADGFAYALMQDIQRIIDSGGRERSLEQTADLLRQAGKT